MLFLLRIGLIKDAACIALIHWSVHYLIFILGFQTIHYRNILQNGLVERIIVPLLLVINFELFQEGLFIFLHFLELQTAVFYLLFGFIKE